MNLSLFGSKDKPLRSSMLPLLMRCPWSAVMRMYSEGTEEVGAAADTGSAVHKAAEVFHTLAKGNVAVSLKVMQECLPDYPQANLDDAAKQFHYYATDSRNHECEIVLCEKEIAFPLTAAKEDPTGQDIVIQGTLDQVRLSRSILTLWDIKTSLKYEGFQLLNNHCYQLAAYQWGASIILSLHVQGAGVIRTRDYLKKTPGPVFWEASWNYLMLPTLMDDIRHEVASIRSGKVRVGPGEDCQWCPASGVGECLPLKTKLLSRPPLS